VSNYSGKDNEDITGWNTTSKSHGVYRWYIDVGCRWDYK